MYHFYEVHYAFVSSFKKLISRLSTPRLSLEETTFLDKNGTCGSMEHFRIIKIYYSRERPSYLPYYVLDKIFGVEVCKQYRLWVCFFNEKRKTNLFLCPGELGR
jgi:hypothetical protein